MGFLDGVKEISLDGIAEQTLLSGLVNINNKEELNAFLNEKNLFRFYMCEVTLTEGYKHNVYLSEISGDTLYVRYPADVETGFLIEELQEIKIISDDRAAFERIYQQGYCGH